MPRRLPGLPPSQPRWTRGRRWRCGALLLTVTLLSGCATYDQRMAAARGLYAAGAYEACNAQIEALAKADPKNLHLYELERGSLQLAMGQPEEAERLMAQGALHTFTIQKS